MNIAAYQQPLPADLTLAVYNDDVMIFSSRGKWLHPLFDLECFLLTYAGSVNNLSVHDKVIGKAAAVLIARLGVKHIHTELVSFLALDYLNQRHIPITYTGKVDRILCATEKILADETDSDHMYDLLRQRLEQTGKGTN